jgi:hypothetical protein
MGRLDAIILLTVLQESHFWVLSGHVPQPWLLCYDDKPEWANVWACQTPSIRQRRVRGKRHSLGNPFLFLFFFFAPPPSVPRPFLGFIITLLHGFRVHTYIIH